MKPRFGCKTPGCLRPLKGKSQYCEVCKAVRHQACVKRYRDRTKGPTYDRHQKRGAYKRREERMA